MLLKRVVASVTAVASPNSAEGVIATIASLPLPSDPGCEVQRDVVIDGFLNFTAGAGTTAIIVRIRRGSLTGTLVGVAQTHVMAAGSVASIAFAADDLPPSNPPVGGSYAITVQQTGGTGAGTANYLVATATLD